MRRVFCTIAAPLVFAALLALIGCGHEPAPVRPVTVKVLVSPEYSLNVMAGRVAPLIARLQESLGTGYRVEWISCPSAEAFLATAEKEQPDVSLQDAYHTAWLARLQQAKIVLQTVQPDGRTTTRGLVITGREGAIRDLAELSGRRIAISSRRSYLGYIAQASMLEHNANVHPGSLHLVPVRWQDRVSACVDQGSADAGFIAETELVAGARVLARTEEVPTACLVTFPHTPETVARLIRDTLAGLSADEPRDGAILRSLGIRGFVAVDAPARAAIADLAEASPVPY